MPDLVVFIVTLMRDGNLQSGLKLVRSSANADECALYVTVSDGCAQCSVEMVAQLASVEDLYARLASIADGSGFDVQFGGAGLQFNRRSDCVQLTAKSDPRYGETGEYLVGSDATLYVTSGIAELDAFVGQVRAFLDAQRDEAFLKAFDSN